MAERICLMTFYPTDCKDNCFNCDCGGAEATKDMYVSIHNVQRVCAITGGAADTDEGEYIAEVIRNNLENMVISAADVQPINPWISVKDRLPENCIEVLVYDTDCGIVIGWYDKEIGDFAADFISSLDAVTHWMPLPEPPKE